jgi:16S rRNA (cytosine967-C5)-methyltransferase
MLEVQRHAAAVIGRVLAGNRLDTELARSARNRADWTGSERAAVQDICYGTLRLLGRIDAILDALLDRPLRDDNLRCLLRVAIYQLEYTRAAPHAIVDHAVRACSGISQGAAKSLTNAVLRNFLRRRSSLDAVAERGEVGRFSHPEWWIHKLRGQYPGHYAAILTADNLHPPLTLRVNRRRSDPAAYLERLAAQDIAAERIGESAIKLAKPIPVDGIPGFAEGLASVQDAAAQRAAELLDLAHGQRVLDACAAPGGKTAHIRELADVDLLALDSDAARLERVRGNLERVGLEAHIVHGDACQPQAWWDGRPFDRILADVPCSASGVVRRHPDIKWLRRPSDVARFAQTQGRMLDALWRLLASGGKLLYATCSVFHEENHTQLEKFLERQHDACQLSLTGADLHQFQPPGQLLPDERHDGFFYALLQKQ